MAIIPKSREDVIADFYANWRGNANDGEGVGKYYLLEDWLADALTAYGHYLARQGKPEKQEGVETELGLDTPRGIDEWNGAIDEYEANLLRLIQGK